MAEAQFLTDGEAEKVSFWKLKYQATEPTALTPGYDTVVPLDLAGLFRANAADHIHQAGLSTSTGTSDQHRSAHSGLQRQVLEHGSGCGRRAVVKVAELQHGPQLDR